MPIARLVRSSLNRFLLGFPGRPRVGPGAPGRRAHEEKFALLGAALLLGSILLHAPAARAETTVRAYDPSTQYLDPMATPLPDDFPRNWHIPVPPPLADPGSSQTQVSLDPTTGRVSERYQAGNVEVRPPLVTDYLNYDELLSDRTYRKIWLERTKTTRSVNKEGLRKGGIFKFELPVQLPKSVRSIVGNGAPSIEVSGSERIAILGTSDWLVRSDAYANVTGERNRQGAFPSFEMQQELNVNMTGSIGDKIKVDVDQSSNVQTSLDNKVKLRYEGDDDDMIKTIELGNTNLSLQGASLRQDGLFGVKTVAKMGNFDFTVIASKQDAKTETARFTPSGEKRSVQVNDLQCIRRTYFFISDSLVETSNLNLKVYRADLSYFDVNGRTKGVARVDPTQPYDSLSNPQMEAYWVPLTIGQDYDIIYPYIVKSALASVKIPVIRLTGQVADAQLLAVAYNNGATPIGITDTSENAVLGKQAGEFLLLKMLKPTIDQMKESADGLFDRTNPWFKTLGYELRNFYDLGGRDIDRSSLTIKIRKYDYSLPTHPDAVGVLHGAVRDTVPLVTLLGLDQTGKAGSENQFQPDGLVDDQFVNTDTGIMFFPDLHPFDPDTSSVYASRCGPGFGGANCLDDLTRNTLWTDTLLVNKAVYYDKQPEAGKDERYFIDAEFKSSQQGFYLGRFGILEGSEQVKVDGVPQRRDADYRIDYESGLITFTRAPGPDQVITVDFSYAPGFGQVQRSLVGLSGGYNPASNLSFSTSLLREARGAAEQNVKLGEEPAHSTLGDFGAVMSFRPVWMTRLADGVPGITTDQPSALNIQGNLSASLPNPNTNDEAYIDDMEGNRESTTMSLQRLSWFWSSVPVNNRKPLKFGSLPADSVVMPVSSLVSDHAMLEWYNPRPDAPTAQQEWDLKPVLTKAEGGDNNHQVLEMNVKPPTGVTAMDDQDWTGITQSFGTVGQDFSRVRFMEIWVNDFTARHDSTKAVLHISVGRVSEDAFWDPNNPPNGKLDTEDKNFDGKLDLGTGPDDPNFEDTGLDGKMDKDEPGYDPATNPDPDSDDYTYDVTKSPDDYSTINRFERSGLGDANARPDTEDLNRNTILDTDNNYVEATIDLADTQYVAIDVPTLYAGDPHVKPGNGWRLFRVPVDAETFRAINGGAGQNVQHMRLWLSNIEHPMKIQVGGVELVGSRWLEAAIVNPDMIARDVQLDVRTRNNKDDAGIYQPPYEVKNQIGNTADQREQSLALGYTRLAEGDTLFAFKTLGAPPSALGWTQYRTIKYYVHGEQGVATQNLRVIARFGPDTLNYYEYSAPVVYDWQKIAIPMDALSQLKERRPATARDVWVDSTTYAATKEVYSVRGNPSFTNITRASFGIAVKGSPPGAASANGEVWIDELRVADVIKDKGTSSNVSIQANFADLMAVNVSVQKQDQDFFRVGQGTSQGSGLNHSAIGFSTTLNLDRFLPTSAVTLPVRVSLQHATDVPKFRTGSDVTLSSGQSDIETRRLDQQTLDMSYRRSSPVRRGLTKYTLDAISGNMSYSRRSQILPQSIDSSWAFTAGGGYDLPIGGWGLRLGKNMKIGLLPEAVSFTAGWTSSRAVNFSRQIIGDSDAVDIRSNVNVRLLSLGTNLSYIPLPSFRVTYSLTSARDMLLHQEGPGGFNKGTEVGKTQTTQINYTPRWLSLLNPNVSLKGQYIEDARPELKLSADDSPDLKNIRNSGAASVTMNLPISKLGGRPGRVRRGPGGVKQGGGSPFTPIRTVFGKFQDIQTSFSFDRSASLTRVAGDPGRPFKSGFSEVTSENLDRTISGSNVAMGRRYTTRASTAFRPTSAITVDIRGDHALSFTDQSFGERRTQRFQWPDLQGRWNDFHRFMHLDQALSSMTLRSGYSKVTDEDGPSEGPVERRINTDTFGPILGWDLVFRSGVRASLSSSLTQATTIDQRVYGVTRDRQTTNTDLRITKTFPAARGIKFPLSKKRIRLPNDLNLNLTANVTGDRQVVSRPGERAYTESDTKGLKVGSGTTYNFSRAISGGFNFEYRQNDDLKQGIKRRGITVDFNAQFSF